MSLVMPPLVAKPAIGRWLSRRRSIRLREQAAELPVRPLGEITLISLRADFDARQQRRMLLRAVAEIPVTQRFIILDVAGIDDHDFGLHMLLEQAIALSARRHFGIVLAGVTPAKLVQLDMTRLLNLVTCYQRTGDALQALLCQRPFKFNAMNSA